ncbi:hypothetical protein J6590_008357 [Homalodisca vitripennis]|nr:hypothetical protein J6590_008357 [Homalodisca vitripennis]
MSQLFGCRIRSKGVISSSHWPRLLSRDKADVSPHLLLAILQSLRIQVSMVRGTFCIEAEGYSCNGLGSCYDSAYKESWSRELTVYRSMEFLERSWILQSLRIQAILVRGTYCLEVYGVLGEVLDLAITPHTSHSGQGYLLSSGLKMFLERSWILQSFRIQAILRSKDVSERSWILQSLAYKRVAILGYRALNLEFFITLAHSPPGFNTIVRYHTLHVSQQRLRVLFGYRVCGLKISNVPGSLDRQIWL